MKVSETGFNAELPIYDEREAILAAVDANQVTIITAETGAGKSTQVPQYLAEHGYQKVIVTQPRILAARNLSRRVREEWSMRTGIDSESLVGYRTAHERDDGPESRILYCTDGLQLVREITGMGINDRQVLILDEVHEWNENMEVLVAWAKKRCQEEPRFKVVIMSATIETDSLAEFYATTAVINVRGRSFPVDKRRGTDVVSEIFNQLLTTKSNVLVFLPGKAEIQDVTDAIMPKATAAGVPIIPLHSQLEATAQQQAFASYPNGKIILSTNIAQTSVTIDDIDVVIDSGLERRSEVRNGVEGLFIAQISQADCLQRAGRAGRTKPGQYILAPYDTLPCLEFDDRSAYATPEILRKHIDRLTLRLANVSIDIEELDFYHDPSKKAIARAKRTLIALGAMTKSGEVTKIGRLMEQFPVESSYARMLIEAQQYDVSVRVKLAAIIGIQEVGGIVKGGTRHSGWHKLTKQTKSDLLAQYDVLLALPNIIPEEYEDFGIIAKNIDKAREVMVRIDRHIAVDETVLSPIRQEEESALLRCIVSGQIDQLWTIDDHGQAVHIATKKQRELSSSTIVRNPKLIAGTPFDLQVPTHSGDLETLHLVQGITAVETNWLIELAPEIFSARRGKVTYDPQSGRLGSLQSVRYGGQILKGGITVMTDNTPQNKRLFSEAFAMWVYEELERQRRQLGRMQPKRVPSIPLRQIQQQVKAIAHGAVSLEELTPSQQLSLTNLARLSTHLGREVLARTETSTSQRQQHDTRHRGWTPAHKRKYNRRKER